MKIEDIFRLVVLAAIWGSSFMFMRVISPVLGPILTTCLRLLIAGLVILIYIKITKFNPEFKKNWKDYFIIGLVSSSIPFLCYAFAALYLPASFSAILNSATPLFGAIFSAIWLAEPLTKKRIAGLILGMSGVGMVSGVGFLDLNIMFILATFACLLATVCYGFSGIYIKKRASHLKPVGIAACSQLLASVVFFPLVPFYGATQNVSSAVLFNLLFLSVVCSAVAYLLYYKLLANVGPTKAYTVTFIIPVFGMLWGYLFLDEVITSQMLLGCGLIISGTRFVVR